MGVYFYCNICEEEAAAGGRCPTCNGALCASCEGLASGADGPAKWVEQLKRDADRLRTAADTERHAREEAVASYERTVDALPHYGSSIRGAGGGGWKRARMGVYFYCNICEEEAAAGGRCPTCNGALCASCEGLASGADGPAKWVEQLKRDADRLRTAADTERHAREEAVASYERTVDDLRAEAAGSVRAAQGLAERLEAVKLILAQHNIPFDTSPATHAAHAPRHVQADHSKAKAKPTLTAASSTVAIEVVAATDGSLGASFQEPPVDLPQPDTIAAPGSPAQTDRSLVVKRFYDTVIPSPDADEETAKRKRDFEKGDHHQTRCALCTTPYTIRKREHHCRGCYLSVCSDCSGVKGGSQRYCDYCLVSRSLSSPYWSKVRPAHPQQWIAKLHAVADCIAAAVDV
ncbi:hypothetical protein DIPPA_34951 [Diplonema papillatum]|nr:hypothetical protein DIPPA_34951 [Diplonema papillatum]